MDVLERWHRAAHHAYYGLLSISTALALLDPEMSWTSRAAATALVALLGGWYWYAVLRHPEWIQQRPRQGLVYFVVAGGLYLGLISLHPGFMFLAFSLYWQVFSFWPTRWAIPGATVLTAMMWSRSAASFGGSLKPSGAAILTFFITVTVSSILSLFVAAIIRQSEERKRLIEELEATRQVRAAGERRAGMLEERGRLAREIHDTLAQGFVSIVTQLEVAEERLPPGEEAVRRQPDLAGRTARENVRETRRLVAALRPEILESSSLPEALQRVTARWSEETGAEADLTVTGEEVELSQALQVTLLRAAQEALANVRRHAHASRVELTLSYMEDLVVLDVQDDGRGFDTARAPDGSTGGLGLVAMRGRAEALDGQLLVESEPGSGTTLAVQLPLTAEHVPASVRGIE